MIEQLPVVQDKSQPWQFFNDTLLATLLVYSTEKYCADCSTGGLPLSTDTDVPTCLTIPAVAGVFDVVATDAGAANFRLIRAGNGAPAVLGSVRSF